MAQNRKPRRGFWDGDDFVDIRSHSDGEVPQRARPLKETGNRRPRSQQRPAPPGRPRPAGDRAPLLLPSFLYWEVLEPVACLCKARLLV